MQDKIAQNFNEKKLNIVYLGIVWVQRCPFLNKTESYKTVLFGDVKTKIYRKVKTEISDVCF